MPVDRRPNILFFFPDQHRFDWTGLNPYLPVRTPNLDQLASQGTVFTNAICPSPLCAPSRASLAAGLDYPRCRVANNGQDYPLDLPTFYGMLRDSIPDDASGPDDTPDSGYTVAGVGKFDLQKAAGNHSLDGRALIAEWGFTDGIDNKGKWDAVASWDGQPHDPYLAYLDARGLAQVHIDDMLRRRGRSYAETTPTPLPEEAYCDNWVAENGLQLLEDFPGDRPWFLQVNFTGPHDPMDVTSRMHARWDGVDFPRAHDCETFDDATHTRIRRNYAAMVENIDRHLGRYLDAIAARGELENTLIVYASDHGEMLGDHDRWGKSSYYQPSVGVPLVIAGPGVTAGQQFGGVVALHDLAATFLEATGLLVPLWMDSRSLWPVLAGRAQVHRDAVLSGLMSPRGAWHLVFDGRYKLVAMAGDPLRLFDLQEDPWEDMDIAVDHPAQVARLHAWLEAMLGA